MIALLDTHSFIWFIEGSPRLSRTARNFITNGDNDVFLSIASLWEMAIKSSLGKLVLTTQFEILVPAQLRLNRISILDIALSHTIQVAKLPFHHRDPFDRLLVAQAIVEDLPLISNESLFESYGVERIWE